MSFADAAKTWNQRYAGEAFLFGETPNAFLAASRAWLAPGQRALSIADGEGRNSVWLARQGLEVDAFDIAEVAVDKARRFAVRSGVAVRYAVADIVQLAWPSACYDVIAAIFIQFAAPAERESIFRGIVGALRPCGPAACCCCKATGRRNSLTAPADRRWPRTCTPSRCCARRSPRSTSATSPAMTTSSAKAADTTACRP